MTEIKWEPGRSWHRSLQAYQESWTLQIIPQVQNAGYSWYARHDCPWGPSLSGQATSLDAAKHDLVTAVNESPYPFENLQLFERCRGCGKYIYTPQSTLCQRCTDAKRCPKCGLSMQYLDGYFCPQCERN